MNKTQNYYDGISKGYKDLYHEEQIQKISFIKEFLPSNQTILDLGSGDGVLNQFLLKNNQIISLDLSHELLKLNTNTNKINANITSIPLKTNSISNIISLSVIQDIPNINNAFLEINRILKYKGLFILTFVKFSSKRDLILKNIQKYFNIEKEIEEQKDLIFILKKK